MNFPAAMRIGSLEMLGALAAFGLIAARVRPALLVTRRAKAVALSLTISDPRRPFRHVDVTVVYNAYCVIGRSSKAGVQLDDPEVSRLHASLYLLDGVLYLADMHSSNGTFLNGKWVGYEGIEVVPGDDIDVGNTRITLDGMEAAL